MNIDNFCNLGAALQNKQIEVGKQPQIYFYRSNEDSIYEMLSEGYFNALNLRVAKDDLILLYSPKDEQKVFAKVVSNSGGIVQIIKMTEDDFQHYEMPTPSIEYLNKIVQYIGNTTAEYTNGFFYRCVESSENYIWENIIVQDSYLKSETYSKSETYNKTEIDTELAKKLNTDGSNTFTGVLKMRSTVSFKGAVAPSWSGIGIYELNDNDSVSLMASMEKIDGFTPANNNTYNIGVNSRKWKDLYLAGKAYIPTINNGGDIAIPTSAGTMALTSDLTNFADKDLSNLTSKGKNIANWSSNVSNCITEIPQDIKLELNSGTLTLKAGSKIYIPNGAGVFDEVTVPSDVIFHTGTIGSASGSFMLFCNSSGEFGARAGTTACASGTTNPSTGYNIWYDTTNNKVKYSQDADGNFDDGGYSLPVGIYIRTNGVATSIDKVFNESGCFGSTKFILPGVKGLIPDGRNEDGTLKSIEFNITNVKTRTFSWDISGSGQYLFIGEDGGINSSGTNIPFYQQEDTPPAISYAYWYKPSENIMYSTGSGTTWNKVNYMMFGQVVGNNTGKITSFTSKSVFHAVDYNEYNNIDFVIDSQEPTAENNYTWFRLYKSGWIEQGGKGTKSATATSSNPSLVNLPITMANATYCIYVTANTDADDYYELELYVGSRTTTSFGVFGGSYNKNGNNNVRHGFYWEVKGKSNKT